MGVDVRGGLQVSLVESLDQIVEPVVAYLNNPPAHQDLFDVDHIIVPNAGVRAWLLQHIAQHVGVTPGKRDGIAAQVNIKYLGALDSFLGRGFADADPWQVGPMAVTILKILATCKDAAIQREMKRLGGGLKAARAMADKFDQYHARRPSMIMEWITAGPNLAPMLTDDFRDGRYVAQPLAPGDRWQYDLWKLLYQEISTDPWVAQVQHYLDHPEALDELNLPPRLIIAGVQSLSARHIRMLQVLARRMEISVYMVHPSPQLARKWTAPANNLIPTQIIAPAAPKRIDFDDSVDSLVGMWLRGAHDAQKLLESQGISIHHIPEFHKKPITNTLIALQQSVRSGVAEEIKFVDTDRSVQMHRAHNLGRQVEILHEALVHAFNDHRDLEPHDVVIMCADIEAAAPLLQATFGRTVKSSNGDYVLPLVVADRGLRFVDDGASLLANILTAVRGRFSITDVMSVATSSLVLQNFNANNDDVESWYRIIERTRIRWGSSQHQRSRMGVSIYEDAHTWSAGLERALTGALLSDSPLAPSFGDVVPLADIEASDIDAIAALSRIVSVLAALEEKANGADLTIIEWADAVEEALTELGADARGELDNAREVIKTMREYVGNAAGHNVETATTSFTDFADLLNELIAGTPGRQPLRTGAITATSMVPLRSVPFKVVCLVGFDEGTMRAGDAEGDDLVSRQDFIGDSNPRIDQRRAILDAVVSAKHQLIITCNGRSIKDNQEVPLITPLSEFLDWCDRCGVPKKDKDGNHQRLEYQHPRHFGAAKNFIKGDVVPGIVWSHDEVGLAALGAVVTKTDARVKAEEVSQQLEKAVKQGEPDELVISPQDFLRFIDDPMKTFVQYGLKISTWSDEAEDEPALVPLTSRKDEVVDLCRTYVDALDHSSDFSSWHDVQKRIGSLPFGEYGNDQAQKVKKFGDTFIALRAAWGIAPVLSSVAIDVPFKGGRVKGDVPVYLTDDNCIALTEYQPETFGAPSQSHMAHLLLLLLASGQRFKAGHVLFRRFKKDQDTYLHYVELEPNINTSDAISTVAVLSELFMKAMNNPYPLFDTAAEKINAGDRKGALKAFRSRITSARTNADGESFSFVGTREALVYGALPAFDDVYTKDVLAFFSQYFSSIVTYNKELAAQSGDKNIAPPHGGPKRTQRYVFQ